MKMQYTFNIQAYDIPSRLIMIKAVEESEEHIILKLLSYLIFYRDGIKIEQRAGQHYKPDLFIEGENYQPVLWVDCGKIAIKKLDKVATKNHKCDIYIVKKSMQELLTYYEKSQKRVKRVERVRFVCFDDEFVKSLASALQRINYIYVKRFEKGKHISLTFNDVDIDSKIYVMNSTPVSLRRRYVR